MALSWNEVKDRALKFSKEWADTSNEEADAKPFLVEFFNVFGITSKRVATFEHRVKKLDDKDGYIDLLWKGMILIEMKSRGKNLDKAYQQAIDYTHGLKQHELPKYILVSDFENFRLYDLEDDNHLEFKLNDLASNVRNFGSLIGYQKRIYKEQDPANIKAAELMGKLHDRLKNIGYTGHPLEVYLVRILFCLFAEDTTIFEKHIFQQYIEKKTNEDGSDLAAKLQELFQVLNTPLSNRFKNIDEQLNEFPYVNGKLFEETLPIASFDSKMRQSLLECCYLDWSKISPAIFGSMFQSVMNPTERRNLGAHYTSETNILKLIKPLFLDELWQEFENVKGNKNKLPEFHKKLSTLKFLDPACGCGNFLVITYRELRLLELAVLRELHKTGQRFIDIENIIWLNVDQFYGIEYEEFPARIAEVAMWLIDHQMNMLISNEFGQYFARLPLKKAATIVHGDALEIDWHTLKTANTITVYADELNYKQVNEPSANYGTLNVIAKKVNEVDQAVSFPASTSKELIHYDYILGNPPFIGSNVMKQNQRDQIIRLYDNVAGGGTLDYVAGWYIKAAKYIKDTKIKVAFVSTNSIVQGEQTSILWTLLLNKYNVKIHFAHRTFKWSNEAKGNAAVYCVIVGFANYDTNNKSIFEYDDIKGEAHEVKAKNINPYLLDGINILINKINQPICSVPQMIKGSSPTDGGFLLLEESEKIALINLKPELEAYIKKYVGSFEFINNQQRWCLWLKDANPKIINSVQEIKERLNKVKEFRLKSNKASTRKWAEYPSLFIEERQPLNDYIIIPRVSSENRKYIPIGFLSKDIIVSDSAIALPNASLYYLGILTSLMHMCWVNTVCGRLKSDYRYSNTIVYNNYPFPENPSEKQIKNIEEKAQKVLDVRTDFPDNSLADLYGSLTMPPALVKAHNELDNAVDAAYRSQPFTNEVNRMVFLFELYEKYTANLFTTIKENKSNRKTK